MPGERTTRLRHLHQAQHSLVHARASGGRDNDDWSTFSRSPFDCPGDSFTNDRSHCGREKTEIHYRERYLVAVENAVPADDRIDQARALLIFFQPVLVTSHPFKPERI